ncbi:amidase [Methylobacterium radiotolerans]|uniref:Indoleacetamide hydrolase n=1 Tax=Methylobacterium radiotolerans (strain ATCC 27329 / DSM 1819 / JCM 2831 / NBRC 15690 / NCIMB 10815 / 0-1) TaxID=426355 RepID=B1LYT4_METRJ|nr:MULTISPECIES: amidase [Methylobacterium]ACB22911.1 Amidase [Methylobacterium radiotolerans JCM 2831]MDE3745250.1 amidase [Methylobacterium radiotolerans]ONF46233.1 amidase [Methylobacterium radiotolerans]PVY97158.1 aspartyl-tRNA(Asn)/glutamyl-tRNA(Gln) amidotransferase subunit A [Methylobacterium organophilum]UIY42959.1 amidase [Methylobacterium radiotolerans]
MSDIDPVHASAAELARSLQARTLSPVDAVEALLGRIERLEPRLQAFTEVFAADARLAAEGADRAIRSGHAVGPLHGVPVVLKDLIDLEGRITMGGSAAHRARRAERTATIARRLIGQGMIVLGKTHTVEFAYGGWGTNQHLGTPWNPWDPETPRTPGGSSSGTGVSVAARMAPWGIGTDTGGSVRLPASFCGLTGLKVTVGRVSTWGIVPLSMTLDTPGPLARTVEDTALLYEAISGPDPRDPTTRGVAPDAPWPALNRGVRGLRLGRMPDPERDGVAPDMLAAYDAALDLLAGQGAEIVDVALPFRFSDCVAMSQITNAEAYFVNGTLAEDPSAELGDAVRARILAGANVSAQEYLGTLHRRAAMKQQYDAALAGIDALLTPTTESAAVALDAVDEAHLPSRFTRFGNLLDLCALALPNGFTASGLPLSLQIVCRGYEETTALRIGQAYQRVTDWHLRRPPV